MRLKRFTYILCTIILSIMITTSYAFAATVGGSGYSGIGGGSSHTPSKPHHSSSSSGKSHSSYRPSNPAPAKPTKPSSPAKPKKTKTPKTTPKPTKKPKATAVPTDTPAPVVTEKPQTPVTSASITVNPGNETSTGSAVTVSQSSIVINTVAASAPTTEAKPTMAPSENQEDNQETNSLSLWDALIAGYIVGIILTFVFVSMNRKKSFVSIEFSMVSAVIASIVALLCAAGIFAYSHYITPSTQSEKGVEANETTKPLADDQGQNALYNNNSEEVSGSAIGVSGAAVTVTGDAISASGSTIRINQ